MNKVYRVVGTCDILAGIIDIMNGRIMMGIVMLLVGIYLVFVDWE